MALGLEASRAHGCASQRAHMHIPQPWDIYCRLKGGLGRWSRQSSVPPPCQGGEGE